MCSLCGILGCDDHWTNAVARPGVYTRNLDSRARRAETARRLGAANAILSYRRLRLDVWQGRSYVVSSPTGAASSGRGPASCPRARRSCTTTASRTSMPAGTRSSCRAPLRRAAWHRPRNWTP